tara:strand:- start:2306 stop:3139 length:834 start_codon:yes stop_codon:yes gene_type:complete
MPKRKKSKAQKEAESAYKPPKAKTYTDKRTKTGKKSSVVGKYAGKKNAGKKCFVLPKAGKVICVDRSKFKPKYRGRKDARVNKARAKQQKARRTGGLGQKKPYVKRKPKATVAKPKPKAKDLKLKIKMNITKPKPKDLKFKIKMNMTKPKPKPKVKKVDKSKAQKAKATKVLKSIAKKESGKNSKSDISNLSARISNVLVSLRSYVNRGKKIKDSDFKSKADLNKEVKLMKQRYKMLGSDIKPALKKQYEAMLKSLSAKTPPKPSYTTTTTRRKKKK